MLKKNSALIWVCIDCMLVHANGEANADNDLLWSKISADTEITMGMLRSEHNCCEGHESLDGAHMGETVYCDGTCNAECECETQSFSSSSCDGCGSSLGGERHAFTLWFD